MPPAASASSTALCLLAFRAGSKSAADAERATQRSSTAPVESETSLQGSPGASRTTLTFCPGARNGLTASATGHAYSRAIHMATRADTSSKAGSAKTCETGLTLEGSTPAAGSPETDMT